MYSNSYEFNTIKNNTCFLNFKNDINNFKFSTKCQKNICLKYQKIYLFYPFINLKIYIF